MSIDTIRIGGNLPTPPPTKALTYLPTKLDASACLAVLAQIDPEVKTESISAARGTLSVERVDSALEYTSLGISDRMRFKAALSDHGIISSGRKV
jgi:hypothetical protein